MPGTELGPAAPTPRGARRAGGDGGFAVPVVLSLMMALSLLGLTGVLLTTTDLRVSGLYGMHDRAVEAATSGLAHGVATYRDHGATASAWPIDGSIDGFAYRTTVRRDSFDFGDGVRPVSIDAFERRNPDGVGAPVHVITATASRGRFTATQRLWLSPLMVPRIPGAISVNGPGSTVWTGGGEISGLDASSSGRVVDPGSTAATGACRENRPALHFNRAEATAPGIGVRLTGNPLYAGASPPFVTRGSSPGWRGAEDLIGGPSSALEREQETGREHGRGAPPTLTGVTWITDGAGSRGSCLTRGGCASIDGEGILLVHNPRYDPREHDPADPLYDPVKVASPSHQPATLADISGGTFRGLVVVDRLPERTTGPFSIIGGLVELGHFDTHRVFDWHRRASVQYSCEAIENAVRSAGLGPDHLAWKGF